MAVNEVEQGPSRDLFETDLTRHLIGDEIRSKHHGSYRSAHLSSEQTQRPFKRSFVSLYIIGSYSLLVTIG